MTNTNKKTISPKVKLAKVVKEVKLVDEQKEFDYSASKVLLSVKHLKQFFRFGRGIYKYTKAVHDVSFDIYDGEIFGLVGESGCGKTTTGRSIIKLYKITSGDIYFDGVRIAAGTRWNEKEIKYTNIRLNKYLSKIEQEKKEKELELKSDFFAEFNKEMKLHELRSETNLEGVSKEDKKRYLDKYNALNEEYIKLKNEKIKESKEVVNKERQEIKEKKYDDKYCNKDIRDKAVKDLKLEYGKLIKEAKLKPSLRNSKEYKEYLEKLKKAKHTKITSNIQMIFQDPIASLNPRMTVRNIVAEGLKINGVKGRQYIDDKVNEMLLLVGLLPEHANRYPHEFSGGQRQRIGIARALIMNPKLIIADEPVSALDVSIQAQIINLLNDLRNRLGLTILFIAHNLSVVKYFCDRIAVMHDGELVELATSDELFMHPLHPYTKSLLSAVPHPDPNIEKERTRIVYNPAIDHDYSKQGPTLIEICKGHFVLCNDEEKERYLKELKTKSIYAK